MKMIFKQIFISHRDYHHNERGASSLLIAINHLLKSFIVSFSPKNAFLYNVMIEYLKKI